MTDQNRNDANTDLPETPASNMATGQPGTAQKTQGTPANTAGENPSETNVEKIESGPESTDAKPIPADDELPEGVKDIEDAQEIEDIKVIDEDSDEEQTEADGKTENTDQEPDKTEEKKQTIDEIVGNADEAEREMDYVPITDQEFQLKTKEIVLPSMLKFFHPELLNRFDDIVFFSPLRKEDLERIVELMLREPREMLGEKNIQIKISDLAKAFLAKKGYNPAFGARPLRRAIQQYVEDPLADALILQEFVHGDSIFIDLHEDETKLTFKKDLPDDDNSKVVDPFAILDEKPEAEDGEQPSDKQTEPNPEENGQDEANKNQSKSGQADQEQQNENQQSSQNEKESEEEPKKKSFFEKLFVKAKTDHPEDEQQDEPKTGEAGPPKPDPGNGEKGIRFVDGKIVED